MISSPVCTALVALACASGQANAGDLSPLSDFGTSPINNESAFLTQVGQNNIAVIDQRLPNAWSGGNYAEIGQHGAGNIVRTLQEGDANRLRVAQLGNDNYANITQQGSRNAVDLQQNDSGSRFTAVQRGDDNLIVHLQPGGSTGTINQLGDRNIIKLNQSLSAVGLNIGEITQKGNEIRIQQN